MYGVEHIGLANRGSAMHRTHRWGAGYIRAGGIATGGVGIVVQ